MKIKKLVLENFRQFKGEQPVNFSLDNEEQEVSAVFKKCILKDIRPLHCERKSQLKRLLLLFSITCSMG